VDIAFRVDASGIIGSGHLMRCLTLAKQLQPHCTNIRFVCRPLPQHLAAEVTAAGFELLTLPPPAPLNDKDLEGELRHAAWLGASPADDARDTLAALDHQPQDWLVIDHYAIDMRWETPLRALCKHILVIDDLADRPHDCDALVDQNLYRNQAARYATLIPAGAQQFIGPGYAFLRDEFHAARAQLEKRSGKVERLFIYFGGADPDNHTARAIAAVLAAIDSGRTLTAVDVVIGREHPDRENIDALCTQHGYDCHVQTHRMAELMSTADLAIGAGGISTFERLYLRLPAIVTPISFNQAEQLEYIASLDYVSLYRNASELTAQLCAAIDNGVTPPPDCVGTDNEQIVRFMRSRAD
jgi:UDP-2,4-diacetamido-2,4,6-trideoxy-beta-L-altropyranose hydrolase